MPRRKDVELVEESFTNVYGQEIKVGDPVLFMGTSWGSTIHSSGIFAGLYKQKDKSVSARINNVSRWSWSNRRYSILPLHRVFKLTP